jgi:adenylylsulfate kinase-like enzyme
MVLQGGTIWFVGKPYCGKATLAWLLNNRLNGMGISAAILNPNRIGVEHGIEEMRSEELLEALVALANDASKSGRITIVAGYLQDRESRRMARSKIQNFLEVDVRATASSSGDELKELYVATMTGEMSSLSLGASYDDAPKHSDIAISGDRQLTDQNLEMIMDALSTRGWLSAVSSTSRGTTEQDAKGEREVKWALDTFRYLP